MEAVRAVDGPQVHEPKHPAAKRLAILLALLAIAVVIAVVGRAMRPKKPFPVVGVAPAFALTDQSGRPFANRDLDGKIWVADFVFTHCTATCPRLTARMKTLQGIASAEEKKKPLGIRFVSFSVDPEEDTPAVMSAYMAKHGADSATWSFVTGDTETMKAYVVDGFKISVIRQEKGANDYDVVHGNWFVLVDRTGRMRGYYPVETDEELDQLAADMLRLARETRE